MEVQVNGIKQEVELETNVSGLLAMLSISSLGIAVAVNGAVVPKTQWDRAELQANDSITIIKATQGG